MLRLSRKAGQAVLLGTGTTVRVIDVRGGRVQLGIEAPPDVVVLRSELVTRCPETGELPPRVDASGALNP